MTSLPSRSGAMEMLQLHRVDDHRRGDESHREVVTFVWKYKMDSWGNNFVILKWSSTKKGE